MTPTPPPTDQDLNQPEQPDQPERPEQRGQVQKQLKWSAGETDRIGNRVQTDYRNAIADHNRRISRWREYYRRWRCAVPVPGLGEEAASNLPVPYVRWNVLTKWSKEMDSLFGDDAEIVAVPVGPSNYARDRKISKYMSWRVFNSMKLTKPFCSFVLRKLLFGRSVAESRWTQDKFEVPNPANGYEPEEVIDYEGPTFEDLWPDDFIVPAEEVKCLHDFSFVIRRRRVRPDDLLRGEAEGKYQGITKHWKTIVALSQQGVQRDWEGEEIKREKDDIEGVLYQRPLSSGEWVMVLEWYGKWRPLKRTGRGTANASEWDFDKREMRQREYCVKFLWDLRLVIGIQDLEDLYPTKKDRRPFVESAMMADGTYWSPGMIELLIDLEDELRTNHNQATEGSQFMLTPTILYRPASGVNPETLKLEPGIAIPVDNPASDVRELKITANMEAATWKEQVILAYGERLTGMSDLHLGRQSDRPNAPRTGVQTQQLLEEGNVRISLDTKILREDMSTVLSHFWDLEYMFSPENVFFRVTEEDAGGLFSWSEGGSVLTLRDRDGRYDFKLQFANSVYSREAKKQQALARYQLDLQNPIIAQNPQALWEVTRQAHEALGDPNFESLVPKPPAPDQSVDPKVEWVRLLHGEEVRVHPSDDDLAHMTRHFKDLLSAAKAQEDGHAMDPEAVAKLGQHYSDHMIQLQQKRVQQAVIEQAAGAMAQIVKNATGGAAQFPHGLFGGPPQLVPPGNPQATGPFPYAGGANPAEAGPPGAPLP